MPKKIDETEDQQGAEAKTEAPVPEKRDAHQARVFELMQTEGLSFAEAVQTWQRENGLAEEIGGGQGQPAAAAQSAGEAEIAALRQQYAQKPRPKREKAPKFKVTVELEARHHEWLRRMAIAEAGVRKMRPEDYTVEMMLVQVLREAYASDPMKAGMILGGATGQQVDFDAKAGGWVA